MKNSFIPIFRNNNFLDIMALKNRIAQTDASNEYSSDDPVKMRNNALKHHRETKLLNIPRYFNSFKISSAVNPLDDVISSNKNYDASKISNSYVELTEKEKQNENKNKNVDKKTIYIISNILSGGARKYIDDLVKNYKNTQIVQINKRENLIKKQDFLPIDVILIQQLTYTNILPEDLLKINANFGCKLVISLHEFCWFCNNVDYAICYHDSYLKNIIINPNILNLFNNASLII